MKRLLLIEDEDVIRRALVRLLARRHFQVSDVATVADACNLELASFDVVLADLRLPGEDGTAIIRHVDPCPVVIMTSHASVRSAVDAMKAGATDYIAKPFDHDELLLVLERAMQRDRLGVRAAALSRDLDRVLPPSLRIRGTSLDALADRARPDTAPPARYWLWGATGAGREAVARALHARGPRAEGPLVVADLASLDEDERAAFPDSDGHRDAPGLRAARNGTLILRCPDRLAARTQAALAERLASGAGADIALSVIADAPPRDEPDDASHSTTLGALFAQGDRLRIAPLDERPHDIAAHARHVLDSIAVRCGRDPLTLEDEAIDWLRARRWPGQLLELEQLVARAALASPDARLGRELLAGHDTLYADAPDLEGYFRWFVEQHQDALSETELAARLGISRKSLWERRQRGGPLRPAEPES